MSKNQENKKNQGNNKKNQGNKKNQDTVEILTSSAGIIPKIGTTRTSTRVTPSTNRNGRGAQTPTPSIRDVQSGTEDYIAYIEGIVSQAIDRYTERLGNQELSLINQFSQQQSMLNSQLNSLTRQSNTQVQDYRNLLKEITSQQETQLSSLREGFEEQNRQSESRIEDLQKDIERLSAISAAPKINVDTRPGVVGFSQAQQSSQQRQRLGMIGTRKATPQRYSSLGLTTAA